MSREGTAKLGTCGIAGSSWGLMQEVQHVLEGCQKMEEDCCPQSHLLAPLHWEEPASHSGRRAAPPLSLRRAPASQWDETGKTNHALTLSPGGLNVKFRLNKPCNETTYIPINGKHRCNQEGWSTESHFPSRTVPLSHPPSCTIHTHTYTNTQPLPSWHAPPRIYRWDVLSELRPTAPQQCRGQWSKTFQLAWDCQGF